MLTPSAIGNLTRASSAPFLSTPALSNHTSLLLSVPNFEGVSTIQTIAFGILSILLAFGGLVVANLQYVRSKHPAPDIESARKG